jgi:hypothetical protein
MVEEEAVDKSGMSIERTMTKVEVVGALELESKNCVNRTHVMFTMVHYPYLKDHTHTTLHIVKTNGIVRMTTTMAPVPDSVMDLAHLNEKLYDYTFIYALF